MPPSHVPFGVELAGRLGPPLFAATLVACLLSGGFDWLHGLLMGLGLALIALEHWYGSHRRGSRPR